MIKTEKYYSFLLPKTCDKYASCSFGETPWPTTIYSIFNETFFNVLNTLNKKCKWLKLYGTENSATYSSVS